MRLDDAFADIQAQPGGWTPAHASRTALALRLSRPVGCRAAQRGERAEAGEQFCLPLLRHARPAIDDAQLDPVRSPLLLVKNGLDLNTYRISFRSVAESVAQ